MISFKYLSKLLVLLAFLTPVCASEGTDRSYDSINYWSGRTCNVTVEEMARESIRLQISGQDVTEKSTCLDQKNFSFFLSKREGSGDSFIKVQHYLSSDVRIKVLNAVKDDYGVVKVHFSIKDNGMTYVDGLEFIILRQKSKVRNEECASILVPTRKKYLLKSCRPRQ